MTACKIVQRCIAGLSLLWLTACAFATLGMWVVSELQDWRWPALSLLSASSAAIVFRMNFGHWPWQEEAE